jgi:hypothetical protein
MTGAEASERDAEQRDKIAAQEIQLQALSVSLLPPTSSLAQGWIRSPAPPLEALEEAPETEAEAEEAIDDPFRPPPSTAPAALPASRAGCKRAPTMKALEAEKAPKRGVDGGKGRRAKG